jgi:hypothetical protein
MTNVSAPRRQLISGAVSSMSVVSHPIDRLGGDERKPDAVAQQFRRLAHDTGMEACAVDDGPNATGQRPPQSWVSISR